MALDVAITGPTSGTTGEQVTFEASVTGADTTKTLNGDATIGFTIPHEIKVKLKSEAEQAHTLFGSKSVNEIVASLVFNGVESTVRKILALRPFFDYFQFDEVRWTRKAPKLDEEPKVHRLKLRGLKHG